MKNAMFLFIILIIFLSNCTKKNNIELKSFNNEIFELDISDSPEINIKMYVNSMEGLRVRNSPSINGDIIAFLDDLSEVLVIRKEKNNINIDGVNGKWTFIEFENIQGWVFGGYLNLEPIKTTSYNNMEDIGDYIYNDLNLKSLYDQNNINRLIEILNIKGSKTIEKISMPNRHDNDVLDDIYTIISDTYQITVLTNTIINRFLLLFLKIKINENNFLRLFPYRVMNEYIADNNFGDLISYDQNNITYGYGVNDVWILEFHDGILYSILFCPYWS